MGKYINTNSKGEFIGPLNKAQALIDDGATVTDPSFKENLVCVVENGIFDAAAYCYSEDEFRCFSDPKDDRPKTWLVYPHVKELTN